MSNQKIKTYAARLFHSIWFFPFILGLLVICLTILKVSGSSMGVYYQYFYGNQKDPALILGKPRTIRSDEWVVNTQMTIAQKNSHFSQVNHNIGSGEDTAIVLDAPYKGWSELSRPHNWAFFILPLENAFAFKWWFMAYLLVISCYFFVLSILPGRKLLAILLSLSLLFSAFIQWWYQYSTTSCMYYSFFIATIVIYILRTKKTKHLAFLSAALCYTLICFALVQYPPFQIPCALAVFAFLLGYLFRHYGRQIRTVFKPLLFIGISLLVTGIVVGTFLLTESSVIKTISSTAYPGKRVIPSGGFDIAHLFSGQFAMQFQYDTRASFYHVMSPGYWNQSEASNFLLLIPFLLMPGLYLHYKDKRQNLPVDWLLLGCHTFILIACSWLFIPHLSLLGKILFLDKVPLNRLLIGLGVLNIMYIVVIIDRLQSLKGFIIRRKGIILYAIAVLIIELIIARHVVHSYPGFVGHYRALAFSLPVPIVTGLILLKRFEWAVAVLLAFSIISTAAVNPLYRGMKVLTDNPLSRAIKSTPSKDSGRWIVEDGLLENMATINGAHSLSGVYTYPQLNLWKPLNEKDTTSYNRYAHITITLDRGDHTTTVSTPTADHFGVTTDACGAFLRASNVDHAVTQLPISGSCTRLENTIALPTRTFYIYKLNN